MASRPTAKPQRRSMRRNGLFYDDRLLAGWLAAVARRRHADDTLGIGREPDHGIGGDHLDDQLEEVAAVLVGMHGHQESMREEPRSPMSHLAGQPVRYGHGLVDAMQPIVPASMAIADWVEGARKKTCAISTAP